MNSKYCIRCRQRKPQTDFNRGYGRPDGLQCYCRQCFIGYYKDNQDRCDANAKEYCQRTKEQRKEYFRQYYLKRQEQKEREIELS